MIARPARWREVGEVLVMRDAVSESSDCSSASRRASWVVAKEGISTGIASLGAMVIEALVMCWIPEFLMRIFVGYWGVDW